MCVADEAFLLGPPKWLKSEWLPPADRKSMQLFQTFKRNAPAGVLPNSRTVQGVYCMTADGEFLSGFFAWAFRDRAERVIQQGWRNFEALAKKRGWKPQPVPATPLNFTGDKPVPQGGVKLEVAVRDLPRGKTLRPGNNETQRCAHNLNWINLSAKEAAAFVPTGTARQAVPGAVLTRLAIKTLKDCVRGQCPDWKKGALRDGKLYVERLSVVGNRQTIRISGFAVVSDTARSFACRLHGRIVYDTAKKSFSTFEFVAAGQRAGRTQFNFRQDDLGPAPMGVAFVMHNKPSK